MGRTTYTKDHGSEHNTASSRHASENGDKVLFNAGLVRNIAATDFNIDSLPSNFYNSLLCLFSRGTAPRNQDKTFGSFLRQPAGDVKTNAASSADDDIGSIGSEEVLVSSRGMDLDCVSDHVCAGLCTGETYLDHRIICNLNNHFSNDLSTLQSPESSFNLRDRESSDRPPSLGIRVDK